jgi:glycosyltransferase involved in cell wall biosynthesis
LPDWQIDLLYNEDVKPLSAIALKDLFQPFAKRIVESEQLRSYEKTLLKTKLLIRQVLPQAFYQPLSKLYQSGPFRQILARIRRQQVNASSRQESNATRQLIKQYDLVHVPLPQHMHLVAEIEVPKLVTVHDLTHRIMPDFHTQPNINLAEQGMKLAEKSNSRYLAISEATASDLAKHYPHTQQKIRVVHEGVSRRFNCSYKDQNFDEFRDKYGLPSSGAYLLSLSTVEPRKNIHHLIKAFIRMKTLHPEVDVHLYICGKKGWLVDELYEQEAAFRGYDIYFTGFVDDIDLPLLYAHARGLCYVSHYEGFGLPILEAMQCGTPVIYGDNSAMPEVAGEGGIGVDSRDQDQLIEAMYQLVSDDELYTRLVTAAWRQANTFSLLKSAFKTLQYYEEVIDKTSKK